MAPTEDKFEAEIHQMVQRTLTERDLREHQKQEAEQRLREIDAELLAYEQTLNSYRKRLGRNVPDSTITNTALRQMTVGQGMETLIREAGGKQRIAAIAQRLFEAGKLSNKRTANSHIRGVMKRNNRFVFLGEGTIGLAEEQITDKQGN